MDCMGNPSALNNQVEERFEPPSRVLLRDAALPSPKRLRAGRSQASPTRPSVSEAIGEGCVLLLPERGGSLKRLHRPNLLGVHRIGSREKLGSQKRAGSTLIALNGGLMKPRKGFTMVTGNKNWE